MEAAVRRKLRDPLFWHGVTQLVKTAVAAVVAWVVAASVLELPQPFLAPWAALLVVHATVYRTFSRGLRQVAAAVVAVLLAAAVGNVLGLDTLAVAVLIVLSLLLGSVKWFGAEAVTVATTALVVLTTGFTDDVRLLSRLLDTGIGVAVGLLVNLSVWPPLLRRTAITAINRIDDRIGELLEDVGTTLETGCTDEDVEAWIERTRDLDTELDQAWALVRQARESARMNPRRSAGEVRDPQEWHSLLHRMEQAIAETRSMARTLGGPAITHADADEIRGVRRRLEDLVRELTDDGPLTSQWPVHGGLVINLRNILDAMDEVASANPLADPPAPIDRLRWRAAARRADRAMEDGPG